MFTTKYRPKNIEKFVGNKQIIRSFIKWLLEWDGNNKKNKCALISGLCGIGKNLLVDLILKKHDYNTIDLALDDDRNKEYINNIIKPLLRTRKTFDGQENVLVVSDIDCGNDYGFISSLIECIKDTAIPIICICDNRYDQSIKPLLNYCCDFKMIKPSYQEIYGLIYNVVYAEKIKIKEYELLELYDRSNGDIRFMLNTLQLSFNNYKQNAKNIQSTNIFDTTAKLLSMDETIDSKYETYWLSNDLHPLMVQENYVNNILSSRDEIKKLENISFASDALSDSDIFTSYVNMTNWEFEPHVAVNIIRSTTKCNKKTMIKFPQILGRISAMYKNKRVKINYEDVTFFEKEKHDVKKAEVKEKKAKEPKAKKATEPKAKKEPKTKN
jgi:replication factor C subunit 1